MLPKHSFQELASKTGFEELRNCNGAPMSDSETIRGLERGLAVLQALHTKPACSLQDLNQLTRIPKPSLLRILRTLEQSGWAARRLADGRYRVGTHFDQVASTRDRYDPLAEAAGSVLERLCRTLSWPSDLMVPAGDHMEIRESSRGHSPFLINRDQIGHPVPWLASAVGRAYLAFCPEKELKQIIATLRKSTLRDDRPARDPKQLDAILSEVRLKGYATRDPSHTGGAYGGPNFVDGLAAIAVPVMKGRRVYGAINLLWIKTAFPIDEFASVHLPALKAAAREIVEVMLQERRRLRTA
jgi:IclR family transcriptional regulator, mhp operon transcriptional activator